MEELLEVHDLAMQCIYDYDQMVFEEAKDGPTTRYQLVFLLFDRVIREMDDLRERVAAAFVEEGDHAAGV